MFKKGDKVIGNKKNSYSITKEGWTGVVVRDESNGDISIRDDGILDPDNKGKIWECLSANNFDLLDATQIPFKFDVGDFVIVREDSSHKHQRKNGKQVITDVYQDKQVRDYCYRTDFNSYREADLEPYVEISKPKESITPPSVGAYVIVHGNRDGDTRLVKVESTRVRSDGSISCRGYYIALKKKKMFHLYLTIHDEHTSFTFADQTDIDWLDYCIAKDKYVPSDEVSVSVPLSEPVPGKPNIGDYVVTEEGASDTRLIKVSSTLRSGEVISVKGDYINVTSNDFFNSGSNEILIHTTTRMFRRASEKEIAWLDYCIANGDFTAMDDMVSKTRLPALPLQGDYIVTEDVNDDTRLMKVVRARRDDDTLKVDARYINKGMRSYFCDIKDVLIHCEGRTFRDASVSEIEWLDYCIKNDTYVDEKDLPNVKVTTFPESGWCKNASADLSYYLATYLNDEYKSSGALGLAWNKTSYWSIAVSSSKPVYDYSDLVKFIIPDKKEEPIEIDAPEPEKLQVNDTFKEGDKVEILNAQFGHGFAKGDIVTIVGVLVDHQGSAPYKVQRKSGGVTWWIGEEECKLAQVKKDEFPREPKPTSFDSVCRGDKVLVCRVNNSCPINSMRATVGKAYYVYSIAHGTVRLVSDSVGKCAYSMKDLEVITREMPEKFIVAATTTARIGTITPEHKLEVRENMQPDVFIGDDECGSASLGVYKPSRMGDHPDYKIGYNPYKDYPVATKDAFDTDVLQSRVEPIREELVSRIVKPITDKVKSVTENKSLVVSLKTIEKRVINNNNKF